MKKLTPDSLDVALSTLSAFLEEAQSAPESLVVVGGAALLALNVVSRTTRDVDILANIDPSDCLVDPRPMSAALKRAASQVSQELQLDAEWLNTGPADQVSAGLPDGFFSRLTKREYGRSLTIYLPDRYDLIHLKLFAVIDQGLGRHSKDLTALEPADEELLAAARWVLTQDASDVFPSIVLDTLKGLGYGHIADQL